MNENLMPELQAMALGLAQARYWELSKQYNAMTWEVAPYIGQNGIIVIDPGWKKIAAEWFDFCQEHEGWSFLVFDPFDIAAASSDEIKEISLET